MLKAKTNDKVFEIDGNLLNGNSWSWDSIEIKEGLFHIVKDDISYNAMLIDHNAEEKTFTIRVNNNNYEVKLQDQYDILLDKLGMSDMASSKINDIKAPMPGLILKLMINEGDIISKGDQVLILEAMKMENILKSPGDGTIKKINIKQGDAVEKNQVLIEFE